MMNKLSIGNIASFLQYTRTISEPITQVSNQLNTLFAALAGAERIFKVLDEKVKLMKVMLPLLEKQMALHWKVPRKMVDMMK